MPGPEGNFRGMSVPAKGIFASERTSTGLPIPSRVVHAGGPGRLWGLGFDPKGEICMVRLDSGVSIECRPAELHQLHA